MLIFPGDVELDVVRWELAGLMGVAAFSIARTAGSSRLRSFGYALGIVGIGAVVVLVKSRLGH